MHPQPVTRRLAAGPADAPFFPDGWLKAKGWPTFERAVSGQIKRASESSWQRIIDPDAERNADAKYCEAPLHPRAFAARLGRAIFTNGRSDCELVARLYADTLAGGFGRARTLAYADAMWTDEEAAQLAEALPLALEVTKLDLVGNDEIGARGLDALAAAIREGAAPKLQEFRFDSRWGAKAAALREACKGRGITVT